MTYDRHTTDILSEFRPDLGGPYNQHQSTVVTCSQEVAQVEPPIFNGKNRGLKCNVSLISTRVCLKFRYPIPSTVSSSCSRENGHFRGWNIPHFWHAAVWWNTARDEWRARANGDWAEDLSCSVSSLSGGDGLQEIHGAVSGKCFFTESH